MSSPNLTQLKELRNAQMAELGHALADLDLDDREIQRVTEIAGNAIYYAMRVGELNERKAIYRRLTSLRHYVEETR